MAIFSLESEKMKHFAFLNIRDCIKFYWKGNEKSRQEPWSGDEDWSCYSKDSFLSRSPLGTTQSFFRGRRKDCVTSPKDICIGVYKWEKNWNGFKKVTAEES